jgi:hypothetical protein
VRAPRSIRIARFRVASIRNCSPRPPSCSWSSRARPTSTRT